MASDIESFGIKEPAYLNNCVSCIGGRKENQDTCALIMTRRGFLALVCDGMGGMNGGATASKVAAEEIIRYVEQPAQDNDIDDDNLMVLRKAICSANSKLRQMATENPALSGMGTTVTVVLINEDKVVGAHVGDSRIYQIRNGRKVFRTFDHSMVFEMVKEGVLTEEQARLSAQSNIILRALGTKDEVVVDTFERPYDKGDIFFLCSDGIWGTMPERELIQRLSKKQHPKILTESLAIDVNNIGVRSGGKHDNLTAAMVKTTANSKFRSKMEENIKKALIVCAVLLLVSIICNLIPRNTIPDSIKLDGEKYSLMEKKDTSSQSDTLTYMYLKDN